MDKKYKTDQEVFWAGSFGDDYIERNNYDEIVQGNIKFFDGVFSNIPKREIRSVVEFGANIGMNLRAIRKIIPKAELSAIEINHKAATILKSDEVLGGEVQVLEQSILDFEPQKKYDFVLIKGVLIHINPNELKSVYRKMYESSSKYICIAEYYNPTPVSVLYRGNTDRLFKRDFAGEFLDMFEDVSLVDYRFAYHREVPSYDDITWFLMEKK